MHQPVLLQAVLEGLAIKPSGIYIDATFGRGGHAKGILERLDENGRLMIIDQDPDAIEYAKKTVGQDKRVVIEKGSFGQLATITTKHQWIGKVDGILFDLGVSS